MSDVGNLNLTSTSALAFRANDEAAHLRRWLREQRPEMTTDAIRQVAHYAGKLLDRLGADAARIVTASPDNLPDRISADDACGGEFRRDTARHLERAGAALYAAVHDLDAETTRQLMDRRTPPRRGGDQLVRADADPQPVGDLFAETAIQTDTPAGEGVSPTPGTPESLPDEVRSVIEAVNYQVTAQLRLDDRLDVRAVARSVLSNLSPAARVRVAAGLPHAAGLPITTGRAKAANTLSDLAEEAIVALLEQRYADLRLA